MIDLFSFSVFNNLLLSCILSSLERQDNLSNYKIIQIMAKEVSKEELYDAFGELIYAICCIDGEISIEEALTRYCN
jgi:Trp operon repressor